MWAHPPYYGVQASNRNYVTPTLAGIIPITWEAGQAAVRVFFSLSIGAGNVPCKGALYDDSDGWPGAKLVNLPEFTAGTPPNYNNMPTWDINTVIPGSRVWLVAQVDSPGKIAIGYEGGELPMINLSDPAFIGPTGMYQRSMSYAVALPDPFFNIDGGCQSYSGQFYCGIQAG